MSSERLLPWAKPLLLCSTLTQATIYVLRPMITYRALELDANAAQVGLIAAVYALFPILLALQFGRLVGKLGEGKFIIAGTFTMILTSVFLVFAHSLLLLAIATALSGIAHLACMIGGQTMVALRTPRENNDRYFGYYTFSASVGHLAGPLLAALVAGSDGVLPKSTSNAFVLGALLSIAALVPVISWRREKPSVVGKAHEDGTYSMAIKVVRKPGILAAIYISLAISAVADVLVVFLPLYGSENNFSPYAVGFILALRAGTTMLSRLFLGRLSERFTTYQLLLWSTLISVLACTAMAFAKTPLSLAAVVFVAGFSLGIGQPLTMSLVSQKTQADERAIAVSARLMGNRIGQFMVPAAAGVIAAASGAGAVFIGLAILLGSSVISITRD